MFFVLTIVLFIVALVIIIKAGDSFVDASIYIAQKSGIPKFVIGATIVSIATTLPELIASVLGTVEGSLGLAVGNAVGSVTANTGLIMSISIIFMPGLVKRNQYAFKTVLLILISSALLICLLNGNLNIFESIILLISTIVFFVENVIVAKKQAEVIEELSEEASGEEEDDKEKKDNYLLKIIITLLILIGTTLVFSLSDKLNVFVFIILALLILMYMWLDTLVGFIFKDGIEKHPKMEMLVNIVKFVIGAAGIYFGAKYLVSEGTLIAQELGVSDEIIGLTLVAIGTSLPELVTTITSIVKRQPSLSVGNIIGANIIDMSLILPICAFVSGGKLVLESMQTAYLDIPVQLVIMFVAFIPMLITKKFARWQGIVMLLIYIAYIVVISLGLFTF